jgi:hypothetical protein
MFKDMQDIENLLYPKNDINLVGFEVIVFQDMTSCSVTELR